MSFDANQLYHLLPAVYRIRDAESGGVLRELVEIIAEQVRALEADLDQLYDDQFIETSAEWVVPYIGDLIGYRDLSPVGDAPGFSRAEVAGTIGYRRRKGTAAMLERLARDVTGWPAVVVEFFQRVATTQYLNHLRPGHRTPSVARRSDLAGIGTPFDPLPHTLDVRRIATGGGWYNLPNIGIFLWRVKSVSTCESPPVPVDARRFRFSPLGRDIPLYQRPAAADAPSTGPGTVPAPLERRHLAEHLEAHYSEGLCLWVRRGEGVVDRGEIRVCDLAGNDDGGWTNLPAEGVAIDPERGRLAFAADVDPAAITTGFHYGFTADLGGGEYDRGAILAGGVRVPADHATLGDALAAAGGRGQVEIAGSGRYEETPHLFVPRHQALTLQAGHLSRPVIGLGGELVIGGGEGGEVILDGLLITGGRIRVPRQVNGGANRLRRLHLRHCTLVPGLSLFPDGSPRAGGAPSLVVETDGTEVEIEKSIVGGLAVEGDSRTRIQDSIVDATGVDLSAYASPDGGPGGPLTILNTTVIGTVQAREVPLAENVLFLGPVRAEKLQEGCVRFSYLPLSSRVPRRYRCRPRDESDARTACPAFTSLRYGEPGYGQLHAATPPEIREGADDGAEMGAFHHLFQRQREANLLTRLAEYLRFGLEAGIFHVS